MVKIGTVWDRTLDVIDGRAAILSAIAALTMLLPAMVSQAAGLAPGLSGMPRFATAISGIAVVELLLWGSLALTTVTGAASVLVVSVGGVVTAGFGALQSVFAAQPYRSVRAAGEPSLSLA